MSSTISATTSLPRPLSRFPSVPHSPSPILEALRCIHVASIDRVALGCFGHYANLHQHDVTFARYIKANEWLVAYDSLSGSMRAEREYGILQYLPSTLVPPFLLFQEHAAPHVEWPKADWEWHVKTCMNEEVYKSLAPPHLPPMRHASLFTFVTHLLRLLSDLGADLQLIVLLQVHKCRSMTLTRSPSSKTGTVLRSTSSRSANGWLLVMVMRLTNAVLAHCSLNTRTAALSGLSARWDVRA
ncbi:hypothetical protein EDB86DRAFT_2811646 [Lactarius hatsudake]|nr:hypothetical protein EDB86DRAFT_2811646 [Lactarius hatsudake]